MDGFDLVARLEGTFGDLELGVDDAGDVRFAFREAGQSRELDLGSDEVAEFGDVLERLADARDGLPADAESDGVYDDDWFGAGREHRVELYGNGVIAVTFYAEDDDPVVLDLDPPHEADPDDPADEDVDDVQLLLDAIDHTLTEADAERSQSWGRSVDTFRAGFNRDQPRDRKGRWTDTSVGAAASKAVSAAKALTQADLGDSNDKDEEIARKAAVKIAANWKISDEDLMGLADADNAGSWLRGVPEGERRERYAKRLIEQWNSSSGGPVAVAAITAVSDKLGLDYSLEAGEQRRNNYINSDPALKRATASLGDAMYKTTQDWLKERGVTEVKVYRTTAKGKDWDDSRPFTSWSISRGGTRIEEGRTRREETVPAWRIFASPATGFGTLHEAEVVLLAPSNAKRSRKRGEGVSNAGSIVRKFNPLQKRAGDGKWTDGAAGGAGDVLNLADRIELGDGEKLISSDRFEGPSTNLTMNFAVTEKPGGREVRIGLVPDEDADRWRGADRGRTVVFEADEVADLHRELSDANVKAKKLAAQADREWNSGNAPTDPVLLGTDPVAEGRVIGEWGDVHYRVYLTDDEPMGWKATLHVGGREAPPDEDGLELEGKDYAKFLRWLERLQRQLEGDASRARDPSSGPTYQPPASSAPKGGQFAVGGGRVSGKGKRPAKPRKRGGPAKPQGPMSFDGKHGTGYGIKGGDPRVRTLQSALNRLGLTDKNGKPLAVDGKYGPLTTSAVKKLQQALGVKPDGKVTPELLKQITELKQLPDKPAAKTPAAKPRRRRTTPDMAKASARARILDQINRALRLGVVVRSQTPWSRSFALSGIEIVSRAKGGDGRTVEAYAAMFNAPYEVSDQHGHYMEVIEPSAFDRSLRGGAARNAMCLYNHGMSVVDGKPDPMAQIPIGTPLEIRADGRGLLTVTRYDMSEYADRILEAIRNGSIRSQSFRGRIMRSSPPDRRRTGPGGIPTITRHELGLTDYGPTPIPVNAAAAIMAVRSKTELLQDFAALDDDDRLDLLRTLGVELDGDDDFEDDTASDDEELDDEVEEVEEDDDTPTSADAEPGAEDPPVKALRSAADITRRLRAEMIRRGIA